MLSQYKILFYISSIWGQTPFSYKYSNDKLLFSYPKIKLIYSILIFTFITIYTLLNTHLSCYEILMTSFLTGSSFMGFFLTWCITYLNNFRQTKKLTEVLKKIYDLEKSVNYPYKHGVHHIYVVPIFVLICLIILEGQLMRRPDGCRMPMSCLYGIFMQYLTYTTFLSTYIFIINELRILTAFSIENLKLEENLTGQMIQRYSDILDQGKDIFIKITEIYQIPITLTFGINFLDTLLAFSICLSNGIFNLTLEDIIYLKLYDFHIAFIWLIQGTLGSLMIIRHSERSRRKVIHDLILKSFR